MLKSLFSIIAALISLKEPYMWSYQNKVELLPQYMQNQLGHHIVQL
jgi:hypothetical protein